MGGRLPADAEVFLAVRVALGDLVAFAGAFFRVVLAAGLAAPSAEASDFLALAIFVPLSFTIFLSADRVL